MPFFQYMIKAYHCQSLHSTTGVVLPSPNIEPAIHSKSCQLYRLFRQGFYIIRYIIQHMETSMRCQLCEKKTHELSYWFDKMVCSNCYGLSRTRSDVILEASAN